MAKYFRNYMPFDNDLPLILARCHIHIAIFNVQMIQNSGASCYKETIIYPIILSRMNKFLLQVSISISWADICSALIILSMKFTIECDNSGQNHLHVELVFKI